MCVSNTWIHTWIYAYFTFMNIIYNHSVNLFKMTWSTQKINKIITKKLIQMCFCTEE